MARVAWALLAKGGSGEISLDHAAAGKATFKDHAAACASRHKASFFDCGHAVSLH